MKIVEVSKDRDVDLSDIGKYMLGDDSALSEEKSSKPFLGQSKAKITNEYLMTNFPKAFSTDRPDADVIIYDGENLVFIPPGNKSFTFREHIQDLFKKSISWRYRYCSELKLSFDQHGFTDDIGEILKSATNMKRYGTESLSQCPAIEITLESRVPENWSWVTNKSENRIKFKQIMGQLLLHESIVEMIPTGKSLTVNGLYDDGKTWIIKNEFETISKIEGITLKYSEADIKMYKLCEKNSNKKFLIVSLDTDTIFIGLLKQVQENEEAGTIYVEIGKTSKNYVNLKELVKQICLSYPLNSCEEAIAGFVRLYAVTGCDFCPYFKYHSKSSLFSVNKDINQVSVMGNIEDLCRLIIDAYERKYAGVIYSDKNESIKDDITRLRIDLFSRKANEQSTIPLFSVLLLQFLRSCLILNYWNDTIHPENEQDLKGYVLQNGWMKTKEGDIIMKLIECKDPFYTYPRNIIKGCSCKKKKCSNCSCRGRNGCSVKMCKCNCFKYTHIDSTETESSEEEILDSFYDFEEVVEVETEEVFFEENPVYSSGSESE